MLARVRHQIHRDLVHVDVQVTLEAHRTCHIVQEIGNDRVLTLEMIRLVLLIACLEQGAALLLLGLCVNSADDVEQSLIINWQDAVR